MLTPGILLAVEWTASEFYGPGRPETVCVDQVFVRLTFISAGPELSGRSTNGVHT